MMGFKKKLKVVFEKAAKPGSEWNELNHRYIPKSISGGTQWGVYDRKDGRILEHSEIRSLPIDALAWEKMPTQ